MTKNIPKILQSTFPKQNNNKNDYIEISNIKIIDSYKIKIFMKFSARFTELFGIQILKTIKFK